MKDKVKSAGKLSRDKLLLLSLILLMLCVLTELSV
jgi:hypothetical protein